MIDYATFQRIQHLHRVEQLTVAQIALAIALDARTVRRWLDEPRFRPRLSCARPSKLDPYKAYIRRLLEHHPYSAAQILNRLREAGYHGGATIVKDYLQRVRPVRTPAFLTLHFAPGECAQVDWGHYGSVAVGNSRACVHGPEPPHADWRSSRGGAEPGSTPSSTPPPSPADTPSLFLPSLLFLLVDQDRSGTRAS